jgi:multiple antibiotic resistance protein
MTKIMGFLIMSIGVQFVVNGIIGIATNPDVLQAIKSALTS